MNGTRAFRRSHRCGSRPGGCPGRRWRSRWVQWGPLLAILLLGAPAISQNAATAPAGSPADPTVAVDPERAGSASVDPARAGHSAAARADTPTSLDPGAGIAGDPAPTLLPQRPQPAPEEQLRSLWLAPAADLDERVQRTLVAARRLGIPSLPAPARALLLDASEGEPLERARAAVALAPDLPDAHLALAAALWTEERAVSAAVGEVLKAWQAAGRNLEAWLYLEILVRCALALALVIGALAFLLAAGLGAVPRASQRIAAIVSGVPPAAVFALLAAALLAPAVAGEGLVGVAFAAAALAIAFGGFAQRVAVVLAAAVLLLGLHPLADRAGAALAAPGSDPVAEAAQQVEAGLGTPLAVPRVERAAADDPFAARAQAMRTRRRGDLVQADARYQALLASYEDPGLVNNAANVRFALGRDEDSIALYERAAALTDDARIYFNLSQAYGRAIRLGEQDDALAKAQALDPITVARLGQEIATVGGAYVVDVPLAVPTVRARIATAVDPPVNADRLRRPVAPGWIGASLPLAAGGFLALALLAMGLGFVLAGDDDEGDFYAGIAHLLQGGSATDPALRVARIAALRQRHARHERIAALVAALVPGAAGVFGRRPFLGLVAALFFGTAIVAWSSRAGIVPDPVVAGATAQFSLGVVAAVALLFYLATTVVAWLVRVKS